MNARVWDHHDNAYYLLRLAHARHDPRRHRLFNLACCTRVADLIDDVRSVRYLAVLLASLEDDVPKRDLNGARAAAFEAWDDTVLTLSQMRQHFERGLARAGLTRQVPAYLRECCRNFVQNRAQVIRSHAIARAARAAWCAANLTNTTAAECRRAVRFRAVWGDDERGASAAEVRAEIAAQADLVRDVFVNPYLPPPTLPEECRRWRDGLLPEMARTIVAEGRWQDLPILADAMEEAGCTDARLLEHARRPIHARGCWLVELLTREPAA
jgi:hypothetical protein